jgi:phage baseplate assembly protein W
MGSLSVKLPLERSEEDGFEMIKNFKTLLLTNPGERVMEPEFGVGLKQFLFENFSESTFAKIERKIMQQAKLYIPIVSIQEIEFTPLESNANALNIRIKYSLPNLNIKDLLEFTI